MSDDVEIWKRAWQRERQARMDAEQQLEDSTRNLYLKNQELDQKNKELEQSKKTLVKQHATMLKNEKLATIGMLSAGVAHEINNPLAVVISNLEMLSNYNAQLLQLMAQNQQWLKQKKLPEDAQSDLQQLDSQFDFDFISTDAPELLKDMTEGLLRVKDIVSHMKRFSRTQPGEREQVNINECIESALKLVNNEIKDHCQVELKLNPLPETAVNQSELSQVIMNLVINASHAVQENGRIKISTGTKNQQILIQVCDNGTGMSEEIVKNIFNPFFTTKPPGQGTGMGLAVAHGIIQDHNGDIQVNSQLGKGTCFRISLPVCSDTTNHPE